MLTPVPTSYKPNGDGSILFSSSEANRKLAAYCKDLREAIPLNNRVLFIKGPQVNLNAFESEVARNLCYYAYPPTGMQYLKSTLKGRGLEIDILDGNFEFLRRTIEDDSFDPLKWTVILDQYFERHNPFIVGISNLFDVDAPGFMQISEYLREKRPGKQIILAGGQKATYSATGLLKADICHFALQREAENKIKFLFDHIYGLEVLHQPTPQIFFKYRGEVLETEGPPDVVELQGNLIEEYQDIAIEDYCRVGTLSPFSRMAGKDKPFGTVILNRGCHGGCTFCDVTDFSGRKVRSRRVADLLDEISFLYHQRGVRHIEWLDDDFAIYKELVLEALSGLQDLGFTDLTWAASNGIIASCVNYDLMKKFTETRCIGFRIGVESGNPEMLKRIGKPGNIKKFLEFSKLAQQFSDLFIGDNYIIGFPAGQTPKGKCFPAENFGQMMDSFRFSEEMNLDWSNFSVYQPNSSYSEEKKEWADVYEDFIPTKDVAGCRLVLQNVLRGFDVFKIPYEAVPSREQMKEIWIAFNVGRNYILNKNLTSQGRPRKFIDWTEVIQERYPTNPEMSFFLSLAHYLDGNPMEAELQYRRTLENLEDSYWKERFSQFRLTEVLNHFPQNTPQAEQTIEFLRAEVKACYASSMVRSESLADR